MVNVEDEVTVQARSRAELDRLEQQARYGDQYFQQIRFNEVEKSIWYRVDAIERKTTAYGEAVVFTFEFDGSARNIFLSKYYAQDSRYRPLLAMFRTSNAHLLFRVADITVGRDGKQQPVYEFKTQLFDPDADDWDKEPSPNKMNLRKRNDDEEDDAVAKKMKK